MLPMSFFRSASFFFTRLTRFEFWPFWFFYIPMYFYGLWLALRSRSLMYFSTTNPGMKYGGVMGESKFKVLQSIPKDFIPKSILLKAPVSMNIVLDKLRAEGFYFPVILKPDVGERGRGVEVIYNDKELAAYLIGKTEDVIVQEYITGGLEFGVLYHRLPREANGEVTSMVRKGFLTVTGDGKATFRQLIEAEFRARSRLDYLFNKFENELERVFSDGEIVNLEPIGNHCRGTTFFNANEFINDTLNEVFNKISLQIEGFFYGRFDLKVPSLHDLYAGKNIKIFELNGVSSEVAHVYDPDYKLIQAYRDIARHMKYIYLIARKNHELGVPYDPLLKFLKDLRNHINK
jgi:hypothetical protein